MKIVNIENNTKKIYVQRKDIKKLLDFEREIPVTIFDRYFSDIFSVVSKKRDSYFEVFTNPFEVEFLEGLDWIIDYRKFKDLKDNEILEEEAAIIAKQKAVAEQYNNTSLNDEENRKKLLLKYNSFLYKVNSLSEVIKVKQGYKNIPFPIVPDCEGFSINEDDTFVVQQGLNPLQVLIFRKDGKSLVEEEVNISSELVLSSLGELIKYNLDHNEYFGHFEMYKKLSKDKKYVVTTFRIIPPEEKEKGSNVNNSKISESSSLRKKFRNLISGNSKK